MPSALAENSNMTKNELRLQRYETAESNILETGQDLTLGNRRLTRADLGKVQAEIKRLEQIVRVEQGKYRPIGQAI